MRIKLKVASAGQGCVFRFPGGFGNREDARTDGRYDFAKCAAKIREASGDGWIATSSSDGHNATITAVDFAYNLCEICDGMMDEGERDGAGGGRAPHRMARTAQDARASRKVDRGHCSWVRVDVREGFPVRIRVSCDVHGGDMEREWCRDVALLCLEIANGMSDASKGKIEIAEGEECAGMLDRARKIHADEIRRREERAEAEKRRHCERRMGGQCSPCDFGCPFYDSGACRWKEPEGR